jgi:hypothetical protein
MTETVRVDILISRNDKNQKNTHVCRQAQFTLRHTAHHEKQLQQELADQIRHALSNTVDAVVVIFHGGSSWLDRALRSDAAIKAGITRYPGWLSHGYLSMMTQEKSRLKLPSIPPSKENNKQG